LPAGAVPAARAGLVARASAIAASASSASAGRNVDLGMQNIKGLLVGEALGRHKL